MSRVWLLVCLVLVTSFGCGKKAPTAQDLQAEIAILERMEKDATDARERYETALASVKEAITSEDQAYPIVAANSPDKSPEYLKKQHDAVLRKLNDKRHLLETEWSEKNDDIERELDDQRNRVSDLKKRRMSK